MTAPAGSLARAPARRRTALIVLLALAGLINYADRQIIAILKPMIEQSVGWTDAIYGRIVSVFQLSTAISCLGAGWMVDRIGLKWSNPISVGSFSLAAAAHALARTTPQFMLARAGLGVTEALATPAIIKTVGAWFEATRRSVALGWINAANSIGAIVTPLLVPGIALALGWRAAFLVVGVVGFVWTLLWIILYRGIRPTDGAERASAATRQGGWGATLRDRRTWAIVGAKALGDQVWWLLLFWTPDLLHKSFHLGVRALGVPVAAIYAAAIVGSISAGVLSARLILRGVPVVRARKIALLLYGLLALAMLAVLRAPNVWVMVLLLAFGIVAQQGFSVNLFALITDVIPEPRIGTVTSFGAFWGNIAGMGVIWLLGRHLTAGGSYAPFLDLAAISFLVGAAWLHVLLPRGAPSR